MQLTRFLPDEAATLSFGTMLAKVLTPGLTLYLDGELGAGKTTLVRGVLRGLGYAGKVKSPTYTLVELYTVSSLYLYHFDFYRFADPHEWLDAGFREHFNPDTVCFVEWPEKAGEFLPIPDVRIALSVVDAGRSLHIKAETEAGKRCLVRLEKGMNE
ncbi:MAG: tRNA (adenosine(37)-N6)-threonylcarbamoyltransferase complex ATPase subunit type 1 TsaE [Burkholderiales bacterium]|nr:tRNA (adenosine(37)-N6)-threonylcarbamoyltransferase complex ATPase subunit type 1 TsaE [Burkholderiales bacterium]